MIESRATGSDSPVAIMRFSPAHGGRQEASAKLLAPQEPSRQGPRRDRNIERSQFSWWKPSASLKWLSLLRPFDR